MPFWTRTFFDVILIRKSKSSSCLLQTLISDVCYARSVLAQRLIRRAPFMYFLLVSFLFLHLSCVVQIPLDRLLLETDSPGAFPDADPSFLTPLSSESPGNDGSGREKDNGCSCGENVSPQLVGKGATKSGEHLSQSPRKEESEGERERDKGEKGERLNHPANLRAVSYQHSCLSDSVIACLYPVTRMSCNGSDFNTVTLTGELLLCL
jgi:hypothetical protein